MDHDGVQLPNILSLTQIPVEELPDREPGTGLRFAKRMDMIGFSGLRKLLDQIRQIPDAIDLSMGQADFDVPDALKEATINAVRGQCGRYSPPHGYPELVAATKRYVQQHYGLAEDEELMMTTGTSGAITLALLALVGPGDEVLVPDPHFVIYPNLVHLAGATPVYYDLYPDLRLCRERIEECITERTRLLILNTPANPTGGAFTPDELKAVAELSRARQLPVLSDELYEIFAYDAPHVSIKHFLGRQSLLVSGFSKTYGIAGWRLGWAAGDPELIDKMRTLQLLLYVCPPTLVQKGVLAAFDVDMSATVERYRHKRDLLYEGLVDCGYEVVKPAGSFFVFPRVPWGDDLEFCEHAMAEKLIVLPGRFFSRRTTHFRMNFAAPEETLERALEVLARIAKHPAGMRS